MVSSTEDITNSAFFVLLRAVDSFTGIGGSSSSGGRSGERRAEIVVVDWIIVPDFLIVKKYYSWLLSRHQHTFRLGRLIQQRVDFNAPTIDSHDK